MNITTRNTITTAVAALTAALMLAITAPEPVTAATSSSSERAACEQAKDTLITALHQTQERLDTARARNARQRARIKRMKARLHKLEHRHAATGYGTGLRR